MDWSQFFAVFITFSTLWIMAQRIAARHQRAFRIFIIVFAIFWFWLRAALYFRVMLIGMLASLVLSFLFWLLIGRYNPAGDKDEEAIKVYGLDD